MWTALETRSCTRFCLVAVADELLDYEPWGDLPFALFQHDPEPHTWVGNSLADILFAEQDAATAMLRGVLDNVALTNNPRTEIVEGQVNIDDFLKQRNRWGCSHQTAGRY